MPNHALLVDDRQNGDLRDTGLGGLENRIPGFTLRVRPASLAADQRHLVQRRVDAANGAHEVVAQDECERFGAALALAHGLVAIDHQCDCK